MAKAPDKPAEKLDLSGYTLADLEILIAEATSTRNQKRDARRAELMKELDELGGMPEAPAAPRTRAAPTTDGTSSGGGKTRGKAPVKYADGEDKWTGRGALPRWLRAKQEAGENIEKYRVG